jgi:hypothetical protein
MPFHHLAIELTEPQARRALAGRGIRVVQSQVGKGHIVLHPMNKKKVEKAVLSNKALTLELSPAELAETAQWHIQKHGMQGAGFWGKLWEGIKKTWGFLKDSGLATAAADAATSAVSKFAPEYAPAAVAARQGLKKIAGVGIKKMTKSDRHAALKAKGLYLS